MVWQKSYTDPHPEVGLDDEFMGQTVYTFLEEGFVGFCSRVFTVHELNGDFDTNTRIVAYDTQVKCFFLQ